MKELGSTLRNKWNKRFCAAFTNDIREEKIISFSSNMPSFKIVYSRQLEEWQQNPLRKSYTAPSCFFCKGHDEYHYLEEVARFAHLRIWYMVKFAAPCHFLIGDPTDHREDVSKNDVLVLQEMAKETGLSFFGNFRDSGASYPQHIHYQSLEIVFPIIRSSVETCFVVNEVEITKLRYPILAFRLSSRTDNGIRVIAQAIPELPKPYNLLFCGNEIFIVPRTKSVPSNTGGFKFAAAEVAGCIFARSKESYDFFNCQTIIDALNEVCLTCGCQEARLFEEELAELLISKEVSK